MRINTNLTALNTFTQYTKNNSKIASSVEKLSSGFAINSAADNAAGLAISEKMRAQIRGLDKASANAQDAISLVQTAEGSLDSSTEILQRMRELAVQASSDTNEDVDRQALQDEFTQLQQELNDIAKNTTFNKKNLLDGSLATTKTSIGGGTAMATGNLSASVGNAAAGMYNFKVSVVKTADAVAAQTADTLTVSKDTLSSYISSATGDVSGITDASSLLNGNYTISDVTYNEEAGSFTLTATGGSDGNQEFTATINMNSLDTSTNHTITADFTDGTNTFSIDFNLASDAAVNNKNYTVNNIGSEELQLFGDSFVNSKTTFTISGGTDAIAEQKEVQASLTGASNVTLKVGDTQIAFDNGVTVYFDALTAEDLDTMASKSEFTVTAGASNTIVGADDEYAFVSAAHDSAISAGAYSLDADATYSLSSNEATSTTLLTLETGGTARMDAASTAYDATITFNSQTNKYDVTLGGTVYSLAKNHSSLTAASLAHASADARNLTFTANDGTTLTLSIYSDSAAGATDGAVLDKYISDTGGTRHMAGTSVGTSDGFKVVATNTTTTETFTFKSSTPAAAGTAGAAENYAFKDADGNTAFTVTAVNGTTPISSDANKLTALSAIRFTAADGEFKYESTFGSTTSKIEVAKTENAGLTFQVGANEGDSLTINIDRMDTEYLGINGCSINTRESADKAVTAVDRAIKMVSSQRAALGAIQNRLDYKIDNLTTSSENLTAAESQIRDVDMAKEMTEFTNASILQQASISMLAQANSQPQSVLSLLG